MAQELDEPRTSGWRLPRGENSLREVHGSIPVPQDAGFWRKMIAIAACDLAEVIGAAIALNLLFGLPLIWGVCLTALDVLIVLFLQNRGFRYVEALVVALIVMFAGCFAIELWLAKPELVAVSAGFIPRTEV